MQNFYFNDEHFIARDVAGDGRCFFSALLLTGMVPMMLLGAPIYPPGSLSAPPVLMFKQLLYAAAINNFGLASKLYRKIEDRNATDNAIRLKLYRAFMEIEADGATRIIAWADVYTTCLTAVLLRLRVVSLHKYWSGRGGRITSVVTDFYEIALRHVAGRNPSFRQLRDGVAFVYYHNFLNLGWPCLNAADCNHYAALLPTSADGGAAVLARCRVGPPIFEHREVLAVDSDDE
eukprot:GHVU01136260.1.p1 GENE.GHVU01136260.1~~GHVU01136260.1.p1  ORF type:complete len:233 (+),score=16.04 GHVU01136260.1:887-1585(+)